MIVGLLTVIVLISELMPFTSKKNRGIAHMVYTSFKKKQTEQDIEVGYIP